MQWRNQLIKILVILVALAILYYLTGVILTLLIPNLPKPIISIVSQIEPDIKTGISVVIVTVGGYLVIRLIQQLLSMTLLAKLERGVANIIKFSLDVVFYTILVLAILTTLHVNLTGVVVGGAVGGIVIGLAVQTVAQNLLSGVLVTSSRTLSPGDAVSLISWIWGSPIIGEVKKVSLLFTEVLTTNGNLVKIPNSAFLGNTVFYKLERTEGGLVYPLQVNVNADVEGVKVMERAKDILKDYLKDENQIPKIVFSSKNGGTNVFTVIINLNNVNNLNDLINTVNKAFDQAYWQIKNGK
ncbi:MAG: mechanosensitive ion channel family protein [Sulfolobaceae archaeon]|jgi:Small-conductance mechanosensitive channel